MSTSAAQVAAAAAHYQITGGRPVKGEITCLGAKNFATKAMVAACLGKGETILHNAPDIGDVDITKALLEGIGVAVEWLDEKTLRLNPDGMNTGTVKMPDSRHNRLPILLMPALLHRFGEADVPRVGGCNIGKRNVDFHTQANTAFGATVEESATGFRATSKKRLKGTHFTLPYPSVGATETCLFLAVMAEGTSVIANAAIEPEIIELITMLRAMGAIIFVDPNRSIRVEGVPQLYGTTMHVLGDRIEAASWASLACATGGDITVHGIRPNTLGNYLSYYRQVGGGFEMLGEESLRFFRAGDLQSIHLETDVYPGFSTDWQQPFTVLLTQAEGISVVHETVYESRFGYTEVLNQLGARIQLTTKCMGQKCRFADRNHKHSALILGATPLHAAKEVIDVPDLRAGLAYVIAAALAEGTTTLGNIALLERGYGDLPKRLANMNLQLVRV